MNCTRDVRRHKQIHCVHPRAVHISVHVGEFYVVPKTCVFLLLLTVCLPLLVSAEMFLIHSSDSGKKMLILSAQVILFFTLNLLHNI